jgi:hypothetical protein
VHQATSERIVMEYTFGVSVDGTMESVEEQVTAALAE